MTLTILTPTQMAQVDREANIVGPINGIGLMKRAGAAVADVVMNKFPGISHVDVLCGPGNNGGDGYVAATILSQSGMDVALWIEGRPRIGSDAAVVATECPLQRRELAEFSPSANSLVVDALYGAGLARPIDGAVRDAIEIVSRAKLPVVAVDLPSGVSGETGTVLGTAFQAAITVTFGRKKPGHLLYPGRRLCGELHVFDIGISDSLVAAVGSGAFENLPPSWLSLFPRPVEETYKYRRGHVGVLSGGLASTGAARLSAMAAARIGSGAVTLLSPPSALAVNAAHLTSIILRRTDGIDELLAFIRERKPSAFVAGPGLGVSEETEKLLWGIIDPRSSLSQTTVLDADALTMIARSPNLWFQAFEASSASTIVLTPHEGEFGRLFPDLNSNTVQSKLEKARIAAVRTNAVVVYKGPDSVVAAPDGRAAINTNGTPLLATAGSGDVLAGIIAGLAAQGMPGFEAACAAVWIHAEAANEFGPGVIAEDLPAILPRILGKLLEPKLRPTSS